jgi:L-galactose dehydrogenase/L-glyceraldehyde 3-phosphate reductase
MEYRTLGRTGLRISEIGFGCGNVGGMLIRGTEQAQLEAVTRALELGINYFDTAPGYGNGQSEASLGRVLAELRPEIVVATKVRLAGDDLKDVKGAIRRSLEASLIRLKRDSVDVLQLHTQVSVERGRSDFQDTVDLTNVLGKNGVADAFDLVRSEKLVRFAGFTGLGEADALHQVVNSGRFDVVQAYYNLLNPSAGLETPPGFASYDFRQLINAAAAQGMGVAVIRVMAGGALGGSAARTGYAAQGVGGDMTPGSTYESDEAKAQKLSFLIAGDVASLPQAGVRFALMHPGVSTVLVGFSSSNQIEEAVACSDRNPLPETAMERLRNLWATDFRG